MKRKKKGDSNCDKCDTMEERQKKKVEELKKRVLELLEKKLGIVSLACAGVGISRQTFYRWRAEDSAFDAAVEEISDYALDFVESKLLDGINSGDARLIMFYLNAKGKSRGYGKVEDKPSGIVLNFSKEEDGY